MRVPHLRLAAFALSSGVTLGGCAYGLGDPYGGYGGVNVGYGNGYYGSGYGSPYGYGGYGYGSPYGYAGYGNYGGYGYGSPYGYGGYGDPFGWYGNYYYPGSGIYVYDRDRHRRVMTASERTFWTSLIKRSRNGSTATTTTAINRSSAAPRENWSGFNRVRVRNSDSSSVSTSRGSDRSRWNRSSSSTSTDTTTSQRSNGFSRRGHNRPNGQ